MKGKSTWMIWAFTILLVAVFVFEASWALAGKVKAFSADQVYTDSAGKIRNTGKIFFASEKMRMEGLGMGASSSEKHNDMVVIVRKDRNLHWMINNNKKAYFERGIDEKEMESFSGLLKESDVKELGTEKVEGYKCRKRQVTTNVEIMGFKNKSQTVQWISDDFPMPLRVRNEDGSSTELKNIKEGRQPDNLFELPSDYTKVSNLFELMDDSSEERPRRKMRKEDSDSKEEGKSMSESLKKYLPKGFKLPGSGQ